MDDKPDRTLSGIVWRNIHIDDMNKTIIVVGIRAKEDYVFALKKDNTALLDSLKEALGVVCNLCKRLNPQHAGCTECPVTDDWRETIRKAEASS
jgi:hypothetical protein